MPQVMPQVLQRVLPQRMTGPGHAPNLGADQCADQRLDQPQVADGGTVSWKLLRVISLSKWRARLGWFARQSMLAKRKSR